MKLLGASRVANTYIIYKSRNFMKLLGYNLNPKYVRIYKSRNFMKLLGHINSLVAFKNLQE